ncbi:MAG: hypothetical protein IPK78_04670 [Rhodospirillales bacterium]|nr:hypothetical protein [Rhodospirillales bacterium]
MIDQTNSARSPVAAPARGRDGYAAARAVEVRAQSTRYDHEGDARRALDRLSQRLAANQPLRRDVPPGYHLDIQV